MNARSLTKAFAVNSSDTTCFYRFQWLVQRGVQVRPLAFTKPERFAVLFCLSRVNHSIQNSNARYGCVGRYNRFSKTMVLFLVSIVQ